MATEIKYHVLLVDDCPINRILVHKLLIRYSFHKVTVLESGTKALEYLGLLQNEQTSISNSSSIKSNTNQKEEVHLIITDYSMPGVTGFDLLKKIKESPSLKHIPVVIMSSEAKNSRITSCLEEGALDFIKKPVQLSDVEKLKKYLVEGEKQKVQLTKEEQEEEKRP